MEAAESAKGDKLVLSNGTKFILNTEDNSFMADDMKEFTQKAKALDILVGYFVFSGFKEIYGSIGNRPLRILVGIDVDLTVRGLVEKYSNEETSNEQQSGIRERFEKLQIAILNTISPDDPKTIEAARFFVEKLHNKELEIRKTEDPNHAKMYLFSYPYSTNENMPDKGRVVVGSSNLSYQGLSGRNEINVLLKDGNDFDDASNLFEYLWNKSKDLVLADKNTDPHLLEKTWVSATPPPYLMYVRALYEYFSVDVGEFKTPRQCSSDESIFDVTYQTDAIREGIYKLKKHSGCIIADVVGLGKTIVAATIAANLKLKRTIVICPPHLKDQWEDEMERFNVDNASVFSLGKIKEAVKKFSKRHGESLVIIDEGHRFRNEASQTYGLLHMLCMNNKVLLLSATPFNNRPQDIFSMVKLFQIPSHATIQTVNNLGDRMNDLLLDYKKLKKKDQDAADSEKTMLATAIRDLLDPIMIRRTRMDLRNVERYREDLDNQEIKFNDPQPPVSLGYKLGEFHDLYIDTLTRIKPEKFTDENFRATRYCPLYYLKSEYISEFKDEFFLGRDFRTGQKNMATFMQRLLVRRFESCSESFSISLDNLLKSCETILKWYKAGGVPICNSGNLPNLADFEAPKDPYNPDVLDPYENADEDDENSKTDLSKIDLDKLREDEEFLVVDSDKLDKKFGEHLVNDIKVLGDLIKDWKGKTGLDPKLDVIIKELESSLQKEPNRKLIIFTEFGDTAEYLYGKLHELGESGSKTHIKPFIYTGLVKSEGARKTVRRNFDASLPPDEQEDDYNVLIATDAISEGYSLHRAGAIYNYDIPYNPTRIIQRVGRIDRINKKVFDKLFIYNFFPTTIGEKVANIEKIAKFKLDIFRAILGTDAQLLSPTETPEGYYREKFDEEYSKGRDEESWKTKFLNELHYVEKWEKDLLAKAKEIPPRARILRKAHNGAKEGVCIFSKRGDDCRFAFAPSDGSSKPEVLPPEQALEMFKAPKDEKSFKVSTHFYDFYEQARRTAGESKSSRKVREERKFSQGLKLMAEELPSEKKYINKLIEAIKSTGLSESDLVVIRGEMNKKLLPPAKDVIPLFKKKIPEDYLDNIRRKVNNIASAPETVVLSEEFKDTVE